MSTSSARDRAWPRAGSRSPHAVVVGLVVTAALLGGAAGCAPGASSEGQAPIETTAVTFEPGGLTATQQRAADQAVEVHMYSPVSRAGLIDRLTWDREGSQLESFSREDATIAVDSLGIDWNEQAVAAAEDFLALDFGISRPRLIRLLSGYAGIGFTTEQAQRAVDRLDIDWVEQATLNAEHRLEDADYLSRAGLFRDLVRSGTYGFTEEQANAAIDGLGIDWYVQAANATRRELAEDGNLTCDEIIDRLTGFSYEFTPEQARVGARQAEAC